MEGQKASPFPAEGPQPLELVDDQHDMAENLQSHLLLPENLSARFSCSSLTAVSRWPASVPAFSDRPQPLHVLSPFVAQPPTVAVVLVSGLPLAGRLSSVQSHVCAPACVALPSHPMIRLA